MWLLNSFRCRAKRHGIKAIRLNGNCIGFQTSKGKFFLSTENGFVKISVFESRVLPKHERLFRAINAQQIFSIINKFYHVNLTQNLQKETICINSLQSSRQAA